MTTKTRIDKTTKMWITDASDELAVKNGCRFDEERAYYAVDWIQDYCCLYEGDYAGQKMDLVDWQFDATMRLFGWVRPSKEYGRDVRRFRRAGIWIPKKNKKSPTLAAWGLHLFLGDGEAGQKVYSAARDKEQAKISHKSAIAMVEQSEELAKVCKIDKRNGLIVHHESRSQYGVIAGNNFNSQEGLNGSVLIDETHVVDSRLVAVLKGAGISRSEPLHIEVSTAGNNPDGYGKKQYDYGEQVATGKVKVDDYLYINYSAPKGTTEKDLKKSRANLIKLGKLANPAWGHTIKESEFVSSFENAKQSRTDLRNFMMYRLNIWLESVNPWLNLVDWENCQTEFNIEDLRGYPCHAGLDLASVRDMNCLCLCFRLPDNVYRFLWYYWVPEETAHDTRDKNSYLDWAEDENCNLTLTPGNCAAHGHIKADFRDLCEVFNIKSITFDKWNSESTTQEMADGVIDNNGVLIEEGTGVERFTFAQGITGYNEPSKKFEQLILEGKLEHNGDPVTSWQVGHVNVHQDARENLMPVKPKTEQAIHKKIDGVVAGIMALSKAMTADDNISPYASGEGLFVL